MFDKKFFDVADNQCYFEENKHTILGLVSILVVALNRSVQ